jgi:hypothetical protein
MYWNTDKRSDQLQRRRGDLVSVLHCSISWRAVCKYCAECLCLFQCSQCVCKFIPLQCMLGWSDVTNLHVRNSIHCYSNLLRKAEHGSRSNSH